MAMLNEIIYSQLEKLGPSSRLRSFAYTIFALCAWLINVLGFPRMSAYRRRPEGPNKQVSDVFVSSHDKILTHCRV